METCTLLTGMETDLKTCRISEREFVQRFSHERRILKILKIVSKPPKGKIGQQPY